jgi:hypothetical protein
MFRHQNAGKNHSLLIANRKSFEDVAKFKCCIHAAIKDRLIPGNIYYHSVQSLLSSCTLSNNIKMKICKIIIFSIVLYECETWTLTLRKKHRSRIFWTINCTRH